MDRFAVKFTSRRDATLFCNAVQKQLEKDRSHDGFAEVESVSHWKGNGELALTIHFKDPVTMGKAKEFSSGYDAEWKLQLYFLLLTRLMIY